MNGSIRFSLLSATSIAVAVLTSVACSDSASTRSPVGTGGSPATGGTAGSGTGGGAGTTTTTGGVGGGATGGTAGIAATGGSAGTPSTGGAGGAVAVACGPATNALLLDFSPNAGGAGGAAPTDQANFGDATTFMGGTFYYPNANDNPTNPVTSDVTGGNWHITGNIGTYSGFGIYFDNCSKVDLSAYSGIQFTIGGTVGTPATITFGMGTAADTIAYDWFVTRSTTDPTTYPLTEAPNFGRCFPVDPLNQYDGSCGDPSYTVTVPATPAVITVNWADLMGGTPEASVTSSEITSIWWAFYWDWQWTTANAYAVDITVDDIQLVP